MAGRRPAVVRLETELDAPADRVWEAMQHPASFVYVVRGLFGVPALSGRTEPFREGESGRGWLFLFHVLPFSRHTINLVEMDGGTRTMRSREHGGVLRAWNHTLHVEPLAGDDGAVGRSRYVDTIEVDAGPLTPFVKRVVVGIFRYRHRRWHRLVRRHLVAPARPVAAAGNPATRTAG